MSTPLYLGRIVAIGRTRAGDAAAMYRVSSRSFPNRMAVLKGTAATIVPKPGHEGDVMKNPYIAYNCARIVGDIAIVTNGSHTDPIAEKIAAGMPVRDALALSLLGLDFEHDSLDTPRIAAVVSRTGETGFHAVVRKNGLNVHELPLAKGECRYVSTYEHCDIMPDQRDAFNAASAAQCCDIALGQGIFASFLNPVTAVCAFATPAGFELAAKDMPIA